MEINTNVENVDGASTERTRAPSFGPARGRAHSRSHGTNTPYQESGEKVDKYANPVKLKKVNVSTQTDNFVEKNNNTNLLSRNT